MAEKRGEVETSIDNVQLAKTEENSDKDVSAKQASDDGPVEFTNDNESKKTGELSVEKDRTSSTLPFDRGQIISDSGSLKIKTEENSDKEVLNLSVKQYSNLSAVKGQIVTDPDSHKINPKENSEEEVSIITSKQASDDGKIEVIEDNWSPKMDKSVEHSVERDEISVKKDQPVTADSASYNIISQDFVARDIEGHLVTVSSAEIRKGKVGEEPEHIIERLSSENTIREAETVMNVGFLGSLSTNSSKEEQVQSQFLVESQLNSENSSETKASGVLQRYIPGIGPIIPEPQILAVVEYMQYWATKQEGVIMPRNINHLLSPPLDLPPNVTDDAISGC